MRYLSVARFSNETDLGHRTTVGQSVIEVKIAKAAKRTYGHVSAKVPMICLDSIGGCGKCRTFTMKFR